jgi:hypothetical protein
MAEPKTIRDVVLENYNLKKRRNELLQELQNLDEKIESNIRLLEDSFINEALVAFAIPEKKKESNK